MTLTGRHITAGDLTPVTIKTESAYGTPIGSDILYGDVAEGGSFTFTDTANPYITWRYGSRSFNPDTYVTQQKDAGFNASLETRDTDGWGRIIEYAAGNGGTASPVLDSRTEQINVRVATGWTGRIYNGCKTNKLTIKADAPGAVVSFDEEVLAMKSDATELSEAIGVWTESDAPAVQWMNGITINGADIYPQSFSLSIANNLERNRVPNNGSAITGALLEGRREIEFEADVWMEDLAQITADINNGAVGDIVIVLGITNPVTMTLTGVKWMADGTHPDLIQDKQRQTLRFRAAGIVISTPIPDTPGE